jgi:hypothetical protein
MRVALSAMAVLLAATSAFAEAKPVTVNAFSFTFPVMLPGTPTEIFDAATGDISGWWDHSFTKPPKALYIEPKVGGGFIEIFDDAGNGARHATVIVCDRPKMLRFDGPLGLSGTAVQMVHTYTFEAVGDSTRFTVAVSGSGAIEAGVGAIVEGVWKHFLIERFKPYVEAGKHKQKK